MSRPVSLPVILPPPPALTLPEVRVELLAIAEDLDQVALHGYVGSASELAREVSGRLRRVVARATDTERAPPCEDAP